MHNTIKKNVLIALLCIAIPIQIHALPSPRALFSVIITQCVTQPLSYIKTRLGSACSAAARITSHIFRKKQVTAPPVIDVAIQQNEAPQGRTVITSAINDHDDDFICRALAWQRALAQKTRRQNEIHSSQEQLAQRNQGLIPQAPMPVVPEQLAATHYNMDPALLTATIRSSSHSAPIIKQANPLITTDELRAAELNRSKTTKRTSTQALCFDLAGELATSRNRAAAEVDKQAADAFADINALLAQE